MSDVPELPASAPRAEEAPSAQSAAPQPAAASAARPANASTSPRPRRRVVRTTLLVLGPLVVIVAAVT